jgi:hypothetical protein
MARYVNRKAMKRFLAKLPRNAEMSGIPINIAAITARMRKLFVLFITPLFHHCSWIFHW